MILISFFLPVQNLYAQSENKSAAGTILTTALKMAFPAAPLAVKGLKTLMGEAGDGTCSLNPVNFRLGNCILSAVGWVGTLITYIFGSLLWVSGKIFDFSIYTSIINLNSWFVSSAVQNIWIILRDFANIFFIFILLYIAIGTIFELQGVGDPKKMVVDVIIIAMLVNFSGFFVRVTVDATNIVAYEFYKQMGGSQELASLSVGGNLVSKLALHKYFSEPKETDSIELPQVKRLSLTAIILQTFGNVALILAASFVLLVASILFIIRTVVLLFIYIISPLAFISRIIPVSYLNKYKDWQNALFKQSIFAPALLIPLYAVFQLLGGNGGTGLIGASGATGGMLSGSLHLVGIDILILGLMIGSIFMAQKIGAAGASFASKWAGKANASMFRGVSRASWKATRLGGRGIQRLDNLTGGRGAAAAARVRTAATNAGNMNVWGTGATVRENLTSLGTSIRRTEIGKKALDLAKNPARTTGDVIGLAASKMGVKGFDVVGSSAEQRKAEAEAKKKKKEDDEKKRIEDLNKRLYDQIKGLAQTPPNITSFNNIQSVVGGISDDDLKIIDMKIFADFPEAACSLKMPQIKKLSSRKDKLVDDAPHKQKIRDYISDGGNQYTFQTYRGGANDRDDVISYMGPTGAGHSLWANNP